MFKQDFIQALKQTNISVDPEKTTERFKKMWKSLKNAKKDEIIALTDVSKATIYRVYKKGAVSAKLVIAAAQVANINPYYLTGESDEIGSFDEKEAIRMLEDLKYSKLMASYGITGEAEAANGVYRRGAEDTPDKNGRAANTLDERGRGDENPEECDDSCEVCQCGEPDAPEMTEDEMIFLLRALLLREKYSPSVADRLATIKRLLLQ